MSANGNGVNGNGRWRIAEYAAGAALVAALMTPVWQAISSLGERINDVATHGTPPTNAKLAAMDVKFTEIETQFRNLDERTRRMEDHFAAALRGLDEKLQLEIREAIASRGGVTDPRIAVLEEQMKHLSR